MDLQRNSLGSLKLNTILLNEEEALKIRRIQEDLKRKKFCWCCGFLEKPAKFRCFKKRVAKEAQMAPLKVILTNRSRIFPDSFKSDSLATD